MKKEEKKGKQVILAAALVLVGMLAGYAVYIFMPKISELQAQAAEISRQRVLLSQLQQGYRSYDQLKEQAASLQGKASELKKKIPGEINKPEIMLAVYNMAKNSGVAPKNLTFEEQKDEGAYFSMGMVFTCEGETIHILNLVDAFQKRDKYYLALDSITFNQAEKQTMATMRLVAYFYKNT